MKRAPAVMMMLWCRVIGAEHSVLADFSAAPAANRFGISDCMACF
jgi:hypothetical protein